MSKNQADSKSESPTLGRLNIPWCTAVVSSPARLYLLCPIIHNEKYFHKANYLYIWKNYNITSI